MNVLSYLAVSAPKDLWTIIINWIQGAFGNFGWTILFFTLMIKLVMSPLEFLVKLSNKKQQLVQKKCSPQIAKIKKKFGKNQEQVRIQTQAIYKREGLNMGSSCLIMLVNLIFTWVVFFTLFGSLRKISAYEVINQYETIEQAYDAEFKSKVISVSATDEYTDYEITAENYDKWLQDVVDARKYIEENAATNSPELDEKRAFVEYSEDVATTANNAGLKVALSTWEQVKDNWLWVENIWVADATTRPLPTYDKLLSLASDGGYKSYVQENVDETTYKTIATHISVKAEHTKNGYFIIPILVGAFTFLSQLINELHTKLRNKKAQHLANATADATSNTSMKMMKIIMPIIMVFFAFSSSASFGIYLLASSLSSILIGEITSPIINKLTKKQQKEVEEVLEKEANRMIKKGKLQEK